MATPDIPAHTKPVLAPYRTEQSTDHPTDDSSAHAGADRTEHVTEYEVDYSAEYRVEHGVDPRVEQEQRAQWLIRLAAELTPRDRWLLHMLHEHRVLTVAQIAALTFPSTPSAFLNRVEAEWRLRQLWRWSVLDRFPLRRPDRSIGWHYVLGPAGAAVLAAAFELDPHALGYRRDRALALAHSGRLAHQLGVNQWFTDLITTTRRQPFSSLDTWFSATRCLGWLGYRFDAYARFTDLRDRRREFLLLMEGNTESGAGGPAGAGDAGSMGNGRLGGREVAHGEVEQLVVDLKRYGPYALSDVMAYGRIPLLIWLPTTARESAVRAALHAALDRHGVAGFVPVATAPADLRIGGGRFGVVRQVGPGDEVWLPLHADPHRPAIGRIGLTDLFGAWDPLPEPTVYHDPASALPVGAQDPLASAIGDAIGDTASHPWPGRPSTTYMWRGEGALGAESVALHLPAPVPDPLSWRRPPHHW